MDCLYVDQKGLEPHMNKESHGKLSFESFEKGNISGWHVRTRGYDSSGRMKTSGNEIGWIEIRQDIRNNKQQHFLWLERGNGEENIKVLGLWVKGTGKDFVGTKTQNQFSKGESDNISFELGELLSTVALWITKNHPSLLEQKDESKGKTVSIDIRPGICDNLTGE